MNEDYNKKITINTHNYVVDSHNRKNEPDLTIISQYWKQTISIQSGIKKMFLNLKK